MPQLLTLRKLSGVHFVDKGAAISASVAVIKSIKKGSGRPMTYEQLIAKHLEAARKEYEAQKNEPVAKGLPPELQGALDTVMSKLDEQTKAALMGIISAIAQMPPMPATPPKPAEPLKQDQVEPGAAPGAAPGAQPAMPKKEDTMPMDQMQKALKSMPDDARSLIEDMVAKAAKAQQEAEGLRKDLDEARDLIAKNRADAELAEQVEIAKSFAMVPGDVNERAHRLLAVKKALGDDAHKEMVEELKAANEIAKSGGFDAPGSPRQGTSAGSARAKLDEIAKRMMEKDPGMKAETAFLKACQANRALHKQLRREEDEQAASKRFGPAL